MSFNNKVPAKPSGLSFMFNPSLQGQSPNEKKTGGSTQGTPQGHLASAPAAQQRPAELRLPKPFLHTTQERNLGSIHDEGLRAGGLPRSGGMGDPDGRPSCPDGVYVVHPGRSQFMRGDGLPGNVAVFSDHDPVRDINYPAADREPVAGYFPDFRDSRNGEPKPPLVKPLREAQIGEPALYSTTLPMTPRSEHGAKLLIESMNPGNPQATSITPNQAAQKLEDKFYLSFPTTAENVSRLNEARARRDADS
ncbi:hypothetical protein [Burkholderia lata]|uniref:Uncharacterized protein n=1 Tax=Burkholderia lata (strain ATCC 17760 / DSM 23089 / LMG 22485 / NCIMB 9086 / R18194 / 383) TaxID=482957 RepID=A0A6P2GXD3_BURL3|nr:hypothetical protein [Burkholderia lata]VWB09168.1 hypothetical protein BLA15945_00250 [Burkholderia lata]VWB19280.1 hypothetical protein BLA15816_00747 [Burkholderia lata]